MKLSRLVFEAIKNGVYYSDTNFTYSSFMDGSFNPDIDYKNQINNVWFPLNEALHRLSTRDKVPNRVAVFKGESEIDLDNIEDGYSCRNVRNVFQIYLGRYVKVNHKRYGNKLYLQDFKSDLPINIEYKVDIPTYNEFWLEEVRANENKDIDLKESYGISDTACSFIIEYVKSGLLEQIAPEQSNLHRTIAEQYFADLETMNNGFEQLQVEATHRIGE